MVGPVLRPGDKEYRLTADEGIGNQCGAPQRRELALNLGNRAAAGKSSLNIAQLTQIPAATGIKQAEFGCEILYRRP